MKPMIEKLPLDENSSFLVKTFSTPWVEVPWHQHIECELILFIEGHGTCFIGNAVDEYGVDDIFFLGANLPHTFQKAGRDMFSSAVVIQFREDFWGKDFIQMPESKNIRELFKQALRGLRLKGESKPVLKHMIRELEYLKGFDRIIRLCECLRYIAVKQEFNTLSTQDAKELNPRDKERIDKIFSYTIEKFQETITLDEIAGHVGMSVPAFCSYFRKSTKKTYIDFLNEVRIGHACKLLIDTQKSVESISYECGYNTLTHFNRQFRKIKHFTPSAYRRNFISQSVQTIPI